MDQPETLPRALWIDYAASKSKLDLFPMFSLVDGYLRMVTVGGGERERVKCLIFFSFSSALFIIINGWFNRP